MRDGDEQTALDLGREATVRWEVIVAAGPAGFPPIPRRSGDDIAAMLARSLAEAREVVRCLEGVQSDED